MGYHIDLHRSGSDGLHNMTQALALRAAKPGETPTRTLWADRYGGTGFGQLGWRRPCRLPRPRNDADIKSADAINIKGVGRTSLVSKLVSFDHAHGGAGTNEALRERVFGAVNENLFTHGSTQVLGIFATDDMTVWPDGQKERRVLIMRTGRQLRPAHLMQGYDGAAPGALGIFLRGAEDSGDLVTAKEKPDVAATMRNLIEKHALTIAEQYRWRMLHGASSTSNTELDGSELDLGTETSQPRTAPIKVLEHTAAYGDEHNDRADELARAYNAMCKALPPAERKRVNATPIDFRAQMSRAYDAALQRELVSSVGLSHKAADALLVLPESGAKEFANTVRQLSEMSNAVPLNVDKAVVEDGAVVDVFNLLRNLPDTFSHAAPELRTRVRATLDLFALRSRSAGERTGEQNGASAVKLAGQFVDQYTAMMHFAQKESRQSPQTFAHGVSARATFENAPIDQLYRSRLNQQLIAWIDDYEKTGDAEALDRKSRRLIASSLRNVDKLLTQGSEGPLPDGSKDSAKAQRRRHRVRSEKRQQQTQRRYNLEVTATPNGDGRFKLALPGDPIPLSREQNRGAVSMARPNAWQNVDDAKAQVRRKPASGMTISFDTPLHAGDVGRAEGTFHCTHDGDFWLKDGGENFSGYVFAVPNE